MLRASRTTTKNSVDASGSAGLIVCLPPTSRYEGTNDLVTSGGSIAAASTTAYVASNMTPNPVMGACLSRGNLLEHLAHVRESPRLFLREDQLAVEDDLELPVATLDERCIDPAGLLDFSR